MKRLLALLFWIAFILTFFLIADKVVAEKSPVVVFENGIKIEVNGENVEFNKETGFVLVVDDRTVVPARFICTELGFSVYWDSKDKIAFLTKDDIEICLYPMQRIAKVNHQIVELDTVTFLHEGRMYLPLRFIAEVSDCSVSWDNKTKTVGIETNN